MPPAAGKSRTSEDVVGNKDALQGQWRLAVLLGGCLLVGGFLVSGLLLGRTEAWLWTAGAAAVVGFVLGTFRYHLPRNHPPGRPGMLRRTVGRANAVTLVRGGLLAAVAGFLFVEPVGVAGWFVAGCYTVAIVLDWVDGRLARYDDHRTVLGERLDMALDTTGLVIAALVGIRWAAVPVWYLLVPVARYVYRGAVARRKRRGLPVAPLPESRVRRPLAGFQMAFLAGALLPIAPGRAVWWVAVVAVVCSLIAFLRDYLAVTRRLPQP